MRLIKSEEEDESTIEPLTHKREILLLLFPPTITAIGVGDMKKILLWGDLGMSAEPQQEDAHADPAIEIQFSIISDVCERWFFASK
jgi:hypothetical protein